MTVADLVEQAGVAQQGAVRAEDGRLVLADLFADTCDGGVQLTGRGGTGLLKAVHFGVEVGDGGCTKARAGPAPGRRSTPGPPRFRERRERLFSWSSAVSPIENRGTLPIPSPRRRSEGLVPAPFVVTQGAAGRKLRRSATPKGLHNAAGGRVLAHLRIDDETQGVYPEGVA